MFITHSVGECLVHPVLSVKLRVGLLGIRAASVQHGLWQLRCLSGPVHACTDASTCMHLQRQLIPAQPQLCSRGYQWELLASVCICATAMTVPARSCRSNLYLVGLTAATAALSLS